MEKIIILILMMSIFGCKTKKIMKTENFIEIEAIKYDYSGNELVIDDNTISSLNEVDFKNLEKLYILGGKLKIEMEQLTQTK